MSNERTSTTPFSVDVPDPASTDLQNLAVRLYRTWRDTRHGDSSIPPKEWTAISAGGQRAWLAVAKVAIAERGAVPSAADLRARGDEGEAASREALVLAAWGKFDEQCEVHPRGWALRTPTWKRGFAAAVDFVSAEVRKLAAKELADVRAELAECKQNLTTADRTVDSAEGVYQLNAKERDDLKKQLAAMTERAEAAEAYTKKLEKLRQEAGALASGRAAEIRGLRTQLADATRQVVEVRRACEILMAALYTVRNAFGDESHLDRFPATWKIVEDALEQGRRTLSPSPVASDAASVGEVPCATAKPHAQAPCASEPPSPEPPAFKCPVCGGTELFVKDLPNHPNYKRREPLVCANVHCNWSDTWPEVEAAKGKGGISGIDPGTHTETVEMATMLKSEHDKLESDLAAARAALTAATTFIGEVRDALCSTESAARIEQALAKFDNQAPGTQTDNPNTHRHEKE